MSCLCLKKELPWHEASSGRSMKQPVRGLAGSCCGVGNQRRHLLVPCISPGVVHRACRRAAAEGCVLLAPQWQFSVPGLEETLHPTPTKCAP